MDKYLRQLVVAAIVLFFLVVGVLLISVTPLTREELIRVITIAIGIIFIVIGIAGLLVLVVDIRKNNVNDFEI